MDWKTRGRIAGMTLFALSFVSANGRTALQPAAAGAGDPVYAYTAADPRMNAAETEAQARFTQFLAHVLDAEGIARPDAAVKVALPVAGGGHEIIWISPFGQQDGTFAGVLANEPDFIDGQLGDVVTFTAEQVRDWYFFGPDGLMYGSYTTRVMLDDLQPGQAAQIAALLSADPLPAGW